MDDLKLLIDILRYRRGPLQGLTDQETVFLGYRPGHLPDWSYICERAGQMLAERVEQYFERHGDVSL